MTEAHEVFFLIGPDDVVLYRDEGRSPTFLPDSRARWEAIWAARDVLVEIAHSHPLGPLAFSAEDESTMSALESALGRPLTFSVVTPSGMIRRNSGTECAVQTEPPWAAELRSQSGM